MTKDNWGERRTIKEGYLQRSTIEKDIAAMAVTGANSNGYQRSIESNKENLAYF